MRLVRSGFAITISALILFAGTSAASPRAPAVQCLLDDGDVGCLEGLDPGAFPAVVLEQVSRICRVEPGGAPDRVDPGEEAYRAFLVLLNAEGIFPEVARAGFSDMFRNYADRTFEARLASLEARSAMADLAMALVRGDQQFWKRWVALDHDIEDNVRRSLPGAAQRLVYTDPGLRGNYVGWFIEELACSAAWLHALGREEWAQRMLMVGEDVTFEFLPDGDVASLLLANTFCRLLLAGWRDVNQPVSELERQKDQVIQNIRALRKALHFSADRVPVIAPAFSSLLQARVLRQLTAGGFARLVTRGLLSLLPLPDSGFAIAGRTRRDDGHAAGADEIALAANLPLNLAPAGEALNRFLTAEGLSLPSGDAVCLGAGDGAEARAVAAVVALKRVVAVDHSALAVERMQRLGARLPDGSDPIVPVHGDAARYSHPPGTASLVVANHLMEYLEDRERLALLRSAVSWLKPGGVLFINVHLAQGQRFNELLTYKNVQVDMNPIRARVTISGLVPADPEAVQVQHFFTRDGMAEELNVAGLLSVRDLEYHQDIRDTGTGFVEAVVTLRKLPNL